MKLGIMPSFTKGTVTSASWLREFAQAVEAEGAESIWAVEHVVVADDYEPRYSYSQDGRMPGASGVIMPDPLETLSFIAACTERIRLGTGVIVLPLHAPAILAKRVATLDNLSDGRVILGVGSGWQIEEYHACGVPYDDRGDRLDDHIVALRELWQPGYRTHTSEFSDIQRCESLPDPVQPGGPPIVIGGSTGVAARRVGRIGDGFYPYVISPQDYAARVDTIRSTATEHGRDPDAIELTVWPGSFAPGRTFDLDLVKQYAEAGVDRLMIAAHDASEPGIDGIRRLVGDYRAQIIDGL